MNILNGSYVNTKPKQFIHEVQTKYKTNEKFNLKWQFNMINNDLQKQTTEFGFNAREN